MKLDLAPLKKITLRMTINSIDWELLICGHRIASPLNWLGEIRYAKSRRCAECKDVNKLEFC